MRWWTPFVRSPMKKLRARIGEPTDAADTFWAIRDVSFQVNQGEVLGLVGAAMARARARC